VGGGASKGVGKEGCPLTRSETGTGKGVGWKDGGRRPVDLGENQKKNKVYIKRRKTPDLKKRHKSVTIEKPKWRVPEERIG